MATYRRWRIAGETYFFTVVTFGRRRVFVDESAVGILGDSLRSIRREARFRTIAMVVLPDHLHCIWSLPPGDSDFSTRWKRIKREFTVRWIAEEPRDADLRVSAGRRARGERGVWQRRFWEHVVRDDKELESLCDYIHYNPVKHGYSDRPLDWPWSTFSRFVASGDYAPDWGRTRPTSIDPMAFIVGE